MCALQSAVGEVAPQEIPFEPSVHSELVTSATPAAVADADFDAELSELLEFDPQQFKLAGNSALQVVAYEI